MPDERYQSFRPSTNIEDVRNKPLWQKSIEYVTGIPAEAWKHPLSPPFPDAASDGTSQFADAAAAKAVRPTTQQGNLLEQASAQYPILKGLDYGYVENFRPGAGFLEHWEPGDQGVAPSSPTSLDALRPKELPLDKMGLEIRDPTTRPIDVLGDVVSHNLIHTDPVVKQAYEKLQGSLTPYQQSILRDQYEYAKKNEGETGSFEDWQQRAGMPGFFRGYTFKQWPKEFTDKAYTPEQRADLDQLMEYFTNPDLAGLGKAKKMFSRGLISSKAMKRYLGEE